MTKSEKTRQFIIEQSAAIINRKGVAGTSISDLMEATKLAKGGIYGNFESKEEICEEAFDYLADRSASRIENAINGKTTAKEKLFALLGYYLDVPLSDNGGCPLLNFGMEADDTNPVLRQRVAAAIKRSQQRIIRLVEAGQAAGEFSKRIDAAPFAVKMFTMVEGAIFTCRVTNNKAAMKIVVDLLKKEIESF